MASQTLNFISWNANGLKQNRDDKFKKLLTANIVFLQETHIGERDEHIKKYEDEWYFFYTKYSSASKGTAILVKKTLDFEYISDERDNYGRYVVLKCKLEGRLYTLVSVYNHQTDTKTLDNLSRYLQSMTTGMLVIGGDFNTTLNPFIDKKQFTMTKNGKLLLLVEKFMNSLQLADVWRRKNPVKKDFTFYRNDSPVSRLDYYFIPEECVWRVESCEIMDSKISADHRPVLLEINNVSAVPLLKVPKTQLHFRWLSLKKDHWTNEMHLLFGRECSHAVSEVEILSAVHSLQVSDTPRPDNIPVSFYKDKIQDVILYIKMLFERIHRSAFNCSEKQFNETVSSLQDDSQHFFNVDYLIIATILARRLDDFVESLPRGRILKDSATVMIAPKIRCALISLSHIRDELEPKKQINSILNQDLLIIENLLRDANENTSGVKYKQLHSGCPLTPGLMILGLKSYASQIFEHLENYVVFIFKKSVIVCFQLEDLQKVKATVEEHTNEVFEIEILSEGNGEPLQLNALGDDPLDEDWEKLDKEAFGKKEESKIYEEDESMDVDERSAILEESKEDMERFHGMKKNIPPLLPVPSKSTSSSDGLSIHPTTPSRGTKRKHDHELSELTMEPPLTTEITILEQTTEIMTRVNEKVQAMANAEETKTEIDNFIREAICKINKNNSMKKTIGILGESGQGKTSLLNAILEKRYMLPSGCFGACTAVITQIEANLTDSNYTADIDLISKEEWENHLEILFSGLSTECDEQNDSFTKDAKEKITALYGVNAENKSFEDLKNDDKFAEVTNHLSSSNASDFADKLRRYIQYSTQNSGDWYWPLVKSVTIKIPNCHELLEHIVLVDLPGTGDCNKIRDNLWKYKLRECSSVWILSDINRATTNKDTWEMLKYCIKDMMEAGECRDIHFICTKSDTIEEEEYKRNLDEEISEAEDLILHRNTQAKKIVLETIANLKIKKEMDRKVFTVSSKAFFEQKLGLKQDDTEIPKLQNVLKDINKRINQELARSCVTEAKAVLSLIQSKRMAKTEVHKVLEKSLENELKKLDCRFDMLSHLLSQSLSNGVEQSKLSCRHSAERDISPNLPQGNRGFHKILHALCKNEGRYRSKAWNTVLDLNECLSIHMYENIATEFNLIFPVNAKTGISMQEVIDMFSIITCDTAPPASPILKDFIKAKEDKLKQSLKEQIVERKKKIYTSIQKTIKSAMASCYDEAARCTGEGSLRRKQQKLLDHITSLKHSMFDDAKNEVLRQSKELMDEIKESLNSTIQHSIALTQESTLLDVSSEIKELERLLERLQLSD